MQERVAQAVPEEEGQQELGQQGQEQSPDTVVDEVGVDLGAGGEAAAELGGEGHEGHADCEGHFVLVYHMCFLSLLNCGYVISLWKKILSQR